MSQTGRAREVRVKRERLAPNQFMVCGGAWGASDFSDTRAPECPYWMDQLVRSNIVGFRCARGL